ncbi:MAG: hypothetical protein JXB03_06810 [Spirochaetales bacterium]|nr:hypothetical protein [Spirochaetales bacterium]
MERSSQSKIPEKVILWLDRELELSDSEYQELISIRELVNHFSSLVIPHSVLPRKRIDIKKSTLLKKLIRDGYCSLGLAEIEIRPKRVLEGEREQYRSYIEERYTRIIAGPPPRPPFPSSVFTETGTHLFDIHVDDFSGYNSKKLARTEGLIRVNFDDENLPDILVTGSVVGRMKEICMVKVADHLAGLAGSNPDYYSEKIQRYKNSLRGRNLELIEMEIGKLKSLTEKNTREDIARIVLAYTAKDEGHLENFLNDTLSSENNYILTRFTKDNRGDFDFFQSVYFLFKGILNKRHHHTINNSSLLQAIKQSLSGFLTVNELKNNALKANPEVREDEFLNIYRNFEKDYVGLGTSLPAPMILKQTITKDKIREEYLIHVANLDSFLESRLIKASEEIRDRIKNEWKNKLKRHAFDEGMFSDMVFRKQLKYQLDTYFYTLSCFLHNEHLDAYLDAASILSPRVRLLKEHGIERLDLALKIDRQETYDLINQALLSPLSQIARLIFRILHWVYRSLYLHKPEQERKKDALPQWHEIISVPKDQDVMPVHVQVPRILRHCGCSSENELKEKLDSLWHRIPEKNLQRDDVEQNILRDLNSFFTDKEIVYFSSLEFLIDTNVNRILSRGSHLVPYSETLREFIVMHICYCIYVDTYMRTKVRFKKIT